MGNSGHPGGMSSPTRRSEGGKKKENWGKEEVKELWGEKGGKKRLQFT